MQLQLLIFFLSVNLGVIMCWPYWPTDYSSIFVLVKCHFCIMLFCICLKFLYFVYNMEVKFDDDVDAAQKYSHGLPYNTVTSLRQG